MKPLLSPTSSLSKGTSHTFSLQNHTLPSPPQRVNFPPSTLRRPCTTLSAGPPTSPHPFRLPSSSPSLPCGDFSHWETKMAKLLSVSGET